MTTIINAGIPLGTEIVGHDAIMAALDRHHVQYQNWGRLSPFTLEHLLESLDTEQMALKEVETDQHLLLETSRVQVVIEHTSGGTLFELYESHWIWPREIGTMIKRNFRGISKTRRLGEDSLVTAELAIASEPGYSEPGFRNPTNYELTLLKMEQGSDVQKSDKWPGLDVRYRVKLYHGKISESIFNPNGYFMVRWNMSTHYVWKQV